MQRDRDGALKPYSSSGFRERVFRKKVPDFLENGGQNDRQPGHVAEIYSAGVPPKAAAAQATSGAQYTPSASTGTASATRMPV